MELSELNDLICDHFRHYGLRIVAKVVSEEVNRTKGIWPTTAPSVLLMRMRDPEFTKSAPKSAASNGRSTSPMIEKIAKRKIDSPL